VAPTTHHPIEDESDMTDQKTEQKPADHKAIRGALEAGPTEGPFITFNDQVYRATDPDLTTPVASWNTCGFTMEGVSIDALYYAACNPSAIRALLADLDEARSALAALQSAQPAAAVSDAAIYAVWAQHCQTPGTTTRQLVCAFARAILTQRPAALTEREAFEAEMRCEETWGHRSLKKRPDGGYQNWQVNVMWGVWQARASLPAPQQATPESVGWTDADADAARLAMELECLLLGTKDTAAVSRWWKSANEALDLHRARLAAAQAKGAGHE
jgi:hypothetical protein